ncbi:TPA: phage tail tape measure protein, partial [Salmonella enterica subsp. enterica serovar Bahrenfeld]|nr:phage tail tape measure protein [Salmonella enterica subsp. enterica serovar Bahrenfeld]
LAIGAAAAGTAVLGALALPVNAAIGFESKMADIRKVVDGLDDKKAFAQMSDDILTLSTQLPMAAEGIAEIVAAGGQAGIARGDLMQFANDAVKMGVAFDTTAEESGQMMAQWRTAFKLTQEDVVVLADKINYLGNTGPANAKKISDIVTRIGPLGGVAGVASGEIAAMGATIAG